MKTLIVYYSRTGITKKIAVKLSEVFKADIEEIIDNKNRSGSIGWINSGRDAITKKTTLINNLEKSHSKYDLIIIGSPVWAGSLTPAIRTYLINNKNYIKNTAFFCTMGGDNPSKIFIQMEEILHKKPISILYLRSKEVMSENTLDKVDNFVLEIKQNSKKK